VNIKRQTVQRQVLLDALIKLNTHPSVDEIYAAIHTEHPSISKTTAYRNLRQLAAAGIIRQVSLPDGMERYDGRNNRHYHFKCKNCGTIYDVEIGYIEEIDSMVQKMHGFDVDEHDVVFSGVCKKCKK